MDTPADQDDMFNDVFWEEFFSELDTTNTSEAAMPADRTVIVPTESSSSPTPQPTPYIQPTLFQPHLAPYDANVQYFNAYPPPLPLPPLEASSMPTFHTLPTMPTMPISPFALVSQDVNYDDLRRALDGVLASFNTIPLARFKKEAASAWRRRYPDVTVPMRDFQAFVKANIKGVRDSNPEASHAEHMREIGTMWRSVRKPSVSNHDCSSSASIGNKRKR